MTTQLEPMLFEACIQSYIKKKLQNWNSNLQLCYKKQSYILTTYLFRELPKYCQNVYQEACSIKGLYHVSIKKKKRKHFANLAMSSS